MAHYRPNRPGWITDVKPIGFPPPIPESEKPPHVKQIPLLERDEKIKRWFDNIPDDDVSPPPHDIVETSDELKAERQNNQKSYVQGLDTGESSWTRSSNSASPFELKLAELDPEVVEMQKTESRSDPINATCVPDKFDWQDINPRRLQGFQFQRRPQSASSWSTASQMQHSTSPQKQPFKLNPITPSLGYPNAARPLPQYKRLQYDAQKKLQTSSTIEPGEKPRIWKSPGESSVSGTEKETVDCLEAASRTAVWLSNFKQWQEPISPSQPSSTSKYPNSTVKSESVDPEVQQNEANAEDRNTGSSEPEASDWPDPETTEETEVESRPKPEPAVSTIPNAGEWPDPPKLPRILIPNDYDEDPLVAKALAKIHLKFRRRDEEEDMSWHGNPLSDGSNHDQDLSIEVGDMDSDDNKFEVSELIEYKDLSWCIAVPIDKEKTSDKNIQQHLVYSYQSGIDRIFLTTEQTAELKNTLMIKYRKVGGKTEVVPIYSALPSTGLLSVKYRHNKGIEVRVYGIVNFVDLLKDPNSSQRRTTIWTDALGPLYITAAERSNIRRKLMGSEEKIFAPLRMCMLTVKGEFNLGVANGYTPKWSIMSFQPLIEEGPKDPNIGRNLWPARIIRFDDLVIKKMQNGDFWLQSYSNPDVLVLAGSHLTGILLSAGPKYTEKGIMMGFVVPYFIKNAFAYYEALIVGPPRVIMILTEGRFLNYYPKTWPPAIEKMCEKYRRQHELKLFARAEENCKPLGESSKQMKSMQGFHEFHFDFDSYDE